MVNLNFNIRAEEHHHLVRDIKKLTHFAGDVDGWAIINKTILVVLVDTQLPERENVNTNLCRWMVI